MFGLISMASVGSHEAKSHLLALLIRVEKGERIIITRRGVAVAMLVPVETREHREIKEVIAELKQFGRSRKLPAGVTVRDLIEEGRRF
jgi:prevent-host-death family protein